MQNGQKHKSNHDGRHIPTSQPLGRKPSRGRQADSDRSSISVFTEQCTHQPNGTWQRYTRATEEAESQRLISIAKAHGLFYDIAETEKLGNLYSKKTGESKVYANEELGLVFKVHDPFAKRVLKDIHPSDAIYEHIVHNILFTDTRYTFVGITSVSDEVRIILSQEFCMASSVPTDDEISTYLQSMGLNFEDHYYYGNDYLSITDVSADSDNVLKDESGHLYFIDPIIKLKRPAPEVITWLLKADCPMWANTGSDDKHASNIFSRLLLWLKQKINE